MAGLAGSALLALPSTLLGLPSGGRQARSLQGLLHKNMAVDGLKRICLKRSHCKPTSLTLPFGYKWCLLLARPPSADREVLFECGRVSE